VALFRGEQQLVKALLQFKEDTPHHPMLSCAEFGFVLICWLRQCALLIYTGDAGCQLSALMPWFGDWMLISELATFLCCYVVKFAILQV